MPKLDVEEKLQYKCNLCYDRTSVGLAPMCASVCPTGSIFYGTLEELLAQRPGAAATDIVVFGEQEIRTGVATVTPRDFGGGAVPEAWHEPTIRRDGAGAGPGDAGSDPRGRVGHEAGLPADPRHDLRRAPGRREGGGRRVVPPQDRPAQPVLVAASLAEGEVRLRTDRGRPRKDRHTRCRPAADSSPTPRSAMHLLVLRDPETGRGRYFDCPCHDGRFDASERSVISRSPAPAAPVTELERSGPTGSTPWSPTLGSDERRRRHGSDRRPGPGPGIEPRAESNQRQARIVARIAIVATIVVGQLWALMIALDAYFLEEMATVLWLLAFQGRIVHSRALAGMVVRPDGPMSARLREGADR